LGELFRQLRPGQPFAWTGERFVTGDAGIGGDGRIEIEHLHRYFLARQLCHGKHVLDVASGEGYGSAILAQTAEQVVGVELDQATVDYASRTYKSANLSYLQGEAVHLPVDSESVDAVVSFETLEHFADHEAFLADVKRVLKPHGFLLISTPDVSVYSGVGSAPNPYHVRELTTADFMAELRSQFRHVVLLRQRVIVGSAILPDEHASQEQGRWVFERRDVNTFEADRQIQRAPYLLAIASNAGETPIGASLYIHTGELLDPAADLISQLKAQSAAAAAQAAEHLRITAEQGAQRLQEAEAIIREHVANARQQADLAHQHIAQLEAELENSRQQANQREAALTTALNEAREAAAWQERELSQTRQEAGALRQQIASLTLSQNQHELFMQRLSRDVNLRAQQTRETVSLHEKANQALKYELEQQLLQLDSQRRLNISLQTDLEQLRRAYAQICSLIIPVWMRKAVPSFVKAPLRVLKRALRNG
jgi:SAM-dependent methyltransferase